MYAYRIKLSIGDTCIKTRNHIFLIIVSLFITSVMFLKVCECITPFGTVLCDFIAMIGGGILCSIIVSWIIEVRNKGKEKRDKEEQRKYILTSARNRFEKGCEYCSVFDILDDEKVRVQYKNVFS